MKSNARITDWLRAALTMEKGMEVALKSQTQNDQLETTFRQEVTFHLEETKEHIEAIETCLAGYGQAGLQHSPNWDFYPDALPPEIPDGVTELVTAYSRGHFQIAFYQAMQTAAEAAGETAVIELCNTILPDEERMAAWIKENIATIVKHHLRQHGGEAAPTLPSVS